MRRYVLPAGSPAAEGTITIEPSATLGEAVNQALGYKEGDKDFVTDDTVNYLAEEISRQNNGAILPAEELLQRLLDKLLIQKELNK